MDIDTTPTSCNYSWGFWGTIAMAGYDPASAWAAALPCLHDATDHDPYAIRDWLDSRAGRHFADQVVGSLTLGTELHDAIERAVAQRMAQYVTDTAPPELAPAIGMPTLWAEIALAEMEG